MIISKSYLSQYLCIDIIHQRRATSYKLSKTVFFTQTVVAELSYTGATCYFAAFFWVNVSTAKLLELAAGIRLMFNLDTLNTS